jgi:hypothetical protein
MPFSVMRNRFEIGLAELLLIGRMAAPPRSFMSRVGLGRSKPPPS